MSRHSVTASAAVPAPPLNVTEQHRTQGSGLGRFCRGFRDALESALWESARIRVICTVNEGVTGKRRGGICVIGEASLLGSGTRTVGHLAGHSAPCGSVVFGSVGEADELMVESEERRWSALMVSAQEGNECEYRQLLTEVADAIDNYLRRRFGSHDFVEDCVQEALIAIHQARHTYDPHRAFRPWLFAIVRNKAIDTLRQQRNRQRAVDRYQGELETQAQTSSSGEPVNAITHGELLDSLSAQHREALTLTKIVGFSTMEAAAKLGISESALKVRVHRAVRKIRKLIENEEQ